MYNISFYYLNQIENRRFTYLDVEFFGMWNLPGRFLFFVESSYLIQKFET